MTQLFSLRFLVQQKKERLAREAKEAVHEAYQILLRRAKRDADDLGCSAEEWNIDEKPENAGFESRVGSDVARARGLRRGGRRRGTWPR